MANGNELPKWVMISFAFLLGALGTGVTQHFSMGKEVAANTVTIKELKDYQVASIDLQTALIETNRDLVAELRAERALRERIAP
jgi:recombinational DNA repair protein RecT